MPLTRSDILATPGVSTLMLASNAKAGGLTYAEMAADPGNLEALRFYAKKAKQKDMWCRYGKVILALRELAEVLPQESDVAAGSESVCTALVPVPKGKGKSSIELLKAASLAKSRTSACNVITGAGVTDLVPYQSPVVVTAPVPSGEPSAEIGASDVPQSFAGMIRSRFSSFLTDIFK